MELVAFGLQVSCLNERVQQLKRDSQRVCRLLPTPILRGHHLQSLPPRGTLIDCRSALCGPVLPAAHQRVGPRPRAGTAKG
jgi:hypothetical protein